jgi:arsenate reductase
MKTMDVIIYHNPRCGTSRNTLGLIRNAGIEPHIVEYLKSPPIRLLLLQLATRAGVPLRALLRDKERYFVNWDLTTATSPRTPCSTLWRRIPFSSTGRSW